MSTILYRLLWASATIGHAARRVSCVVKRSLCLLLRRLAMEVRHAVRVSRSPLGLVGVLPEVVWMSPLTTGRLRDIWNYLHSSRDYTCWPATPGSICRSGRSTKSLSKLLDKRTSNIICSNMDSISNTKNNK
jgi:hypothetical protein